MILMQLGVSLKMEDTPILSRLLRLGLVVIGGILVIYYLYGPYWKVRRVPGPFPFPLVGHLPYIAIHGPTIFSTLANIYGPIFRFHLGRQPLVIVGDAELCREVGIRKFKSIPNRSIPSPISASPLHQKGLFFTRDSRWATMRNTIICMYQPSHLASLVPTMQSFIESATQSLINIPNYNNEQQNNDIIFSNFSLKLATDIIGQSAFGINFGLSTPNSSNNTDIKNHQVSDFINQHIYSTTTLKMDFTGSFSIILGLLIPFLQDPFRRILQRIPGTMDWKVERTNKKLSDRVNEIVAKKEKEENERGSKDFLSLILNARDSNEVSKNVFSSDYVSALAYEHLLAGSATTAFTLSSILYLVSGHPLVEKKLIEEIDGFGPHDLVPSAHDLQHAFPYLDQVIKEAMRFYTVSPLIARETSASVEIGGYFLPKGTWVWLAPSVLAKDPKNFPEPDKFKPERFNPDGEEDKNRHPYAHIPFGIGPRSCIGQKFALQEIKLSVIHLYRNYVFRHSHNMEKPLELEYGIVLNYKHGVKLQAIRRKVKST